MAIGREELAQHGASSDAPWVALFGTVFDVSSFLSLHPGGRKILADACGSDATSAFMAVHSAETLEKLADQLVSVGELEHSSEETLPERGSEGASMKASGPALAATVESGVTALEVHLHLPDAIASMTTEQLSALTGSLAHTATRASLPESAAQHEIAEGATSAVARPPLDDKPDGAPNLHAALLAGSSSTNASSDGGRAWQGVPQRGDPAASPPEDRTFVLPTDQLHALKNLREIEEAAYSRLPYTSRAMIEHGSEDDETVSNNTGAWSRYALVPRVLRDVNGVDTSAMVLGHRVALPVLAGPASFHDRVHPSGEIAVARGVSQVGGGAVIQGRASQPLPLIIEAAAGAPCFFQLYTAMDVDGATMDRTYVRKVLEHAASLGFLGVFVTVDTPNTGNREKTFGSPQWVSELAANAGFPPDRSGITEVAGPGGPFCTTMSWEDIKWMSGVTNLPIVLKGVSSPLDAAVAAKMNVEGGAVAGIVVSNHGGRNLDGAIGTADALPRCAAAVASVAGSKLQIFVDGGIRRGKDIVRALALGADAVLLGRPVHWSLAIGGSAGVTHALKILQDELAMALQLCGCKTLAEVTGDHVWRTGGRL